MTECQFSRMTCKGCSNQTECPLAKIYAQNYQIITMLNDLQKKIK